MRDATQQHNLGCIRIDRTTKIERYPGSGTDGSPECAYILSLGTSSKKMSCSFECSDAPGRVVAWSLQEPSLLEREHLRPVLRRSREVAAHVFPSFARLPSPTRVCPRYPGRWSDRLVQRDTVDVTRALESTMMQFDI
ncbi:hypothetical protein SAMD00023353_1901180 [Rosellinia necatrix]|uniref:Uncharacterized protein n=1 Tax=Rosellinia necatrix TaxID=77044 RepID=A0A1S8A7U1_ROSNE|nr:hypothetical protein SAMD00023353_1901180 [Rosellinia necatrix]